MPHQSQSLNPTERPALHVPYCAERRTGITQLPSTSTAGELHLATVLPSHSKFVGHAEHPAQTVSERCSSAWPEALTCSRLKLTAQTFATASDIGESWLAIPHAFSGTRIGIWEKREARLARRNSCEVRVSYVVS